MFKITIPKIYFIKLKEKTLNISPVIPSKSFLSLKMKNKITITYIENEGTLMILKWLKEYWIIYNTTINKKTSIRLISFILLLNKLILSKQKK